MGYLDLVYLVIMHDEIVHIIAVKKVVFMLISLKKRVLLIYCRVINHHLLSILFMDYQSFNHFGDNKDYLI